MFLDVSFIGAASYRKEGYKKIYKSLRKYHRRSVCLEDSACLLGEQYCSRNVTIASINDGLNACLHYHKYERRTESNSGKYKHYYKKNLNVFENNDAEMRLYYKNYAKRNLFNRSLVVFDQDPAQQKLSSASSVNSIVNHVAKSIEKEEVGRVSGWAVGFDKLLRDDVGINVFTDFLKKEFSEENIEFWKVCEMYRNIIDSNFRKSKAKEIYDNYISVRAQDAVNIDSVARKHVESELETPTPQTFEVPQQQIFQLMKQDSYARFLKSDLYKSWLMKEMEGQPLELTPEDAVTDKEKLLDKPLEKDTKKKGKGKENEDNKEKRRRSLLPWRQKSKKNKEDKNSKGSKDTKDSTEVINNNNNNNIVKSTNSTPLTDLPGSRKESNARKETLQVEVPETIEEEMEQPRFCRVIMPDGSTTVVGTKQGQTINYVLGKLLEKRGLSIASVDVFLLGSEKPLNLNEDIAVLGSKEVTIERRVLFRMDLPNKKSIGVKAKPNRLIRDVFKPILNKYGFRIDAIDVHLCGHSESLNLDNLVSTIDSQRVIVLIQSEETAGRYYPGYPGQTTYRRE